MTKKTLTKDTAKAISELQQIPGVGVTIAKDLIALGYRKISELKSEDPERMYTKLCELQNCKVDRCMLYVLRCACYYAREPNPQPELLKWWQWSDDNLKKHKTQL